MMDTVDIRLSGSNLLEKVALRSGFVPIPAVDPFLALLKAHVVISSTRLGVFDALADRSLSADEVAAHCQASKQGIQYLLRAGVWAGYLKQAGDRFALAKVTRKFLLKGSPHSTQGFVEWLSHASTFFHGLDDCVRLGRGVDFHRNLTDPELWGLYQRAMLEGSRFSSKALARLVPVKLGAGRLLDVGGSHGLLGAAICRAHPPMKSIVLDLPDAIEHARSLAQKEKIDDVVEHRAGDLMQATFGTANDVILFSNILHNLEPDVIPGVLERAVASATPQATIAVWEVETPPANAKASHSDAYALFCWLASTSGCFTGQQYAEWLDDAGLTQIHIQRPATNPGQVLVTGRVRGQAMPA